MAGGYRQVVLGPVEIVFPFGDPTDIPVTGDWNGDGTKTIGVFRPSTATWYLRNSNSAGPPDIVVHFGNPGDLPVVGDWNNDGIDTIGVVRTQLYVPVGPPGFACCGPFNYYEWYLTNEDASGTAQGTFGFDQPPDIPVTGDWNNDGTDTPGAFAPYYGTWALTNQFPREQPVQAPDAYKAFGSDGDAPVVGDWNGDGTDTLGVFRNGAWYLTNTFDSSGALTTFAFGDPGDRPVTWH